eukprot:TRINITY_DN9010_c0_g1_i1.p1 TRINITY_DN9010_c0_g1~~TRINITY_DN9010_c0_g1_i1.p1  ORF type:complete len:223 (-),score=53.98 TRINITY_DN9010_c0_g1_i1:39-665(-)
MSSAAASAATAAAEAAIADVSATSVEPQSVDTAATEVSARARLVADTEKMLHDVGAYVQGELDETSADYALLEAMNSSAATKYAGMAQTAQELHAAMHSLQTQYAALAPHLAHVETLSASVEQLEATVSALDRYSLDLEESVNSIDVDTLRQAAAAELGQGVADEGQSGKTTATKADNQTSVKEPAPAATTSPATAAPEVSDADDDAE